MQIFYSTFTIVLHTSADTKTSSACRVHLIGRLPLATEVPRQGRLDLNCQPGPATRSRRRIHPSGTSPHCLGWAGSCSVRRGSMRLRLRLR